MFINSKFKCVNCCLEIKNDIKHLNLYRMFKCNCDKPTTLLLNGNIKYDEIINFNFKDVMQILFLIDNMELIYYFDNEFIMISYFANNKYSKYSMHDVTLTKEDFNLKYIKNMLNSLILQ